MDSLKRKLYRFRWLILISFIFSNGFIAGNSLLSASLSSDISSTISETIISIARVILPPAEVVIVPAEEVTLSLRDNATSVYIGTSNRITATIDPVNTTDKSLVWSSSDAQIIEVTNGGIAIARNFGQATITASTNYENVLGTISINVIDFPEVSDFSIQAYIGSTITTSIEKDTTAKLRLSNITPSNAKTSDVLFVSSNTNLATINEDGIIYGVNPGNVTITAQYGNLSKSIALTIVDEIEVVAPTTLELSGDAIGYVGRNFSLTTSFGETIPTDQQLTFQSSNTNVARVNDQGLITPVNFSGYAPRTVTITVYANANPLLQDSIEITIEKVFPLSLQISSNENVEEGKTINITPTFYPLDVTDRQIIYTSSNPNIATVSSAGDFGVILGKSEGMVTITATSIMDPAVQATLEVLIVPASLLTSDVITTIYLFVRKGIGHMALNFVNGILGFLTFFTFFYEKKNRYLWLSLATGLGLGLLFEGLQFFAPGRTPTFLDVTYNTLGYTFAQFFMLSIFFVFVKIQKRKKH